ncbi:DUF2806 domain-containing protein [Paracoccus kondratievae]|uniref:DUF2806 domain-containing protein n=1 Tax=Paracoccus kondratievae TaxID=135740 RepID=A0AAD3RSJ0_9RHOB|nr:DUF2806 domain-containing protein [Paracoccus kondratievae]AZV00285.1 hypothetical protein pkon1_p56 [Paracoccus phage vB_PkoS_Pkon1]GLK63463.1 hypothetical protein GCM10017635_09330 [Paracoccus kondratievae]
MSDDHLSNEVSVSGEMTDTGVKAGAKSRAVASIDRLVGAAVDIGSAYLEGFAARKRAKTDGEVSLIEAAADYGVQKIGASPELAQRAFNRHFRKVLAQQENIEAVVEEAKVDLIEGRQDYEDIEGAMSEEFFHRFEEYSASANTQELRHRWGRVLAAEIRRPGTFSQKVLRVVDELDRDTAELFERICHFRVGPALYKPLMEQLKFKETSALVSAGLLVDPGVGGQHTVFSAIRQQDGDDLMIGGTDSLLFGFAKKDLAEDVPRDQLAMNKDQIGVPAYVLTDAGQAISTILPERSEDLVIEYARLLAKHVKGGALMLLRPDGRGSLVHVGIAQPSK